MGRRSVDQPQGLQIIIHPEGNTPSQVKDLLQAHSIPYQEVLPPEPTDELFIGIPGSYILYPEDASQADEWVQLLESHKVHGVETQPLPDGAANWLERWKEFYQWTLVTPRIAVGPVFRPCPFDVEVTVAIEPGQGFGTGTHESSQLALELLDNVVKPGSTLVDAGSGSGILAIAAKKLGADLCIGFDIDIDAVKESLENAQRNGVTIHAIHAPVDAMVGQFDVVVANMLAFRLLPISKGLRRLVKDGGHLVLAGLIEENMATFPKAFFDDAGEFEWKDRHYKNGWVSEVYQKKARR